MTLLLTVLMSTQPSISGETRKDYRPTRAKEWRPRVADWERRYVCYLYRGLNYSFISGHWITAYGRVTASLAHASHAAAISEIVERFW